MDNGASKILVVDDNPQNVELLEAVLSAGGYVICKAYSGEDALALIDRIDPHVILLDVMMPGMDGYEVCRRIKGEESTRLIPVIMLTALNSLEDRVKGIESGADDFITKPFHKPELLARVKSLIRIRGLMKDLESAQNVLFSLAIALDFNDPYTHGHSQRVSDLSGRLAAFLKLPYEEEKQIRDAGILHDIGKIATDKGILHKPGILDGREYEHIKEHPVVGESICAPLRFAKPLLPIIRNHHERYDGSGYPDGLRGDEICMGAKVISIVDVYDALTTMRPYRRGMPRQVALEVMNNEVKRGCWDPEIFDAFYRMMREGNTVYEQDYVSQSS